ncbi:MAG: pilus assembly protein TadG-related protein [Acidimicrobiales bacterium]
MTRRRDERGAYLVIWALLLTALLIMVAIVIDLGHVRSTRRQAQRTADLSALAAGQNLSGGDVINACRAAVAYVGTNESVAPIPETCDPTFAGACDPATPVVMTATWGDFVITIQNPVLDSEIEDPHYAMNPLTGTRTLEEDGLPCERMRVTVQQQSPPLFAGVIGVTDLTASANAVVRGFIGSNPKQNAGLVVLERVGCEAIVASGNLSSVLVKGSIASDGTPRPGIIQVDTKALAPPCSNAGGNPPAKYAVHGGTLAPSSDRPGAPSIEAEDAGGAPGRLDMYALTFDRLTTHAAYNVPGGGVRPGPTPGVIASRDVVDSVYDAPPSRRVLQLKNNSQALLTSLANAVALCPLCNVVTGSDGQTYHVYPPGTPGGPDPGGLAPATLASGVAACATNDATLIDVAASVTRVYVNCATLDVPNVRFGGTKVVLAGRLSIRPGGMAAFPEAQEIIVGGCGGCSPPAPGTGISVAGALLINTGPLTPLVPTCSDNIDNDGDGKRDYSATPGVGDSGCQGASDWDELSCIEDRLAPSTGPSRLVVATGAFNTTGAGSATVEMCQTFVLMADGGSLPSQDTTTDPTCAGYTNTSGVFVPQPCPATNSFKGSLRIFGTVDWIAPNQTSGPRDTSLPLQNFEDLAVWTEASATSEIKGAGNTITGGVFFFPNATFNFSGQASQLIDLNAQFIARRLLLSGQGTLSMQPNPNDVVETPAPYFALIR